MAGWFCRARARHAAPLWAARRWACRRRWAPGEIEVAHAAPHFQGAARHSVWAVLSRAPSPRGRRRAGTTNLDIFRTPAHRRRVHLASSLGQRVAPRQHAAHEVTPLTRASSSRGRGAPAAQRARAQGARSLLCSTRWNSTRVLAALRSCRCSRAAGPGRAPGTSGVRHATPCSMSQRFTAAARRFESSGRRAPPALRRHARGYGMMPRCPVGLVRMAYARSS